MSSETRYLEEVKRILLSVLGDRSVRVYLFGSRAARAAHRFSDIDVAVLPLEPIPQRTWAELQEKLEESWVPYPIDLLNLEDAPAALRKRVEQEGVLWIG